MKKLILIFLMFFSLNVYADTIELTSESAILLEVSTGKVLFEKNSEEKLYPASMTKIMSMLLIMEAIESNKISLDDEVIISENASSMGGSQVYLQTGEKYKVKELLECVAVASGNDAVVALAEKVAGTVEEFVKMMNEKAKSLGLTNTNFENPHGLHSENHYTTASDMSIIALELLHHEEILEYTSIYEDYLKKNDGSNIWLVNTNRLVRFYEGVDGLKTGFTTEAGYCITTTAKRGNMRLLSVVMKAETSDLRSKDTVNLLNYGFNTYKLNTILESSTDLGSINIEKGNVKSTKIYLDKDINILKKVTDNNEDYQYEIEINNLELPLNSGDKVGIVNIIDNKGNIILDGNIIVKENITKISFLNLFTRVLSRIFSGNS